MVITSIKQWFASPSQKQAARRQPKATLRVENLESRDLMATLSGGLLTVAGTGYDDTIRVSQSGDTIWVETAHSEGSIGETSATSFKASKVSKIKVLGYEGRDSIDVSGVNVAVEVRGGPNQDTLRGGLKGDTLYGQAGNDLIYGTFGQDQVDGGSGNDKLRMEFNLDDFFASGGRDSTPFAVDGTDTYVVHMDLGKTGGRMIGNFVGQVQQFTKKLQPIADLLSTKLPLPDGGSSPSLGKLLGGNYKDLAKVINAVNKFDASAFMAGEFYLGTFKVSTSGTSVEEYGNLTSRSFQSQVDTLSGKYFDMPIFTSSRTAFRAAMGDNLDLFRFDVSVFNMTSGSLNKNLGAFMVGPVPVTIWLTGALKLQAGGSIEYDMTGIREKNLVRGVQLNSAYVNFKAPVALEGMGGTRGIGAGFGGEIAGVVKVKTGDFRLGSGQNLRDKLTVSGAVTYRAYAFVEWPNFWGGYDREEWDIYDGKL